MGQGTDRMRAFLKSKAMHSEASINRREMRTRQSRNAKPELAPVVWTAPRRTVLNLSQQVLQLRLQVGAE